MKNTRNDEAIFKAAYPLDFQARAEFLGRACGEDRALLERVQALLRIYDEERSFLEVPLAAGATVCEAHREERPGTVIGPYKLLQQIGEGGFGVVYMAEQQVPVRRKVALKVVKPGMDTKEVIARFETERQALALMDHVNIARVFDAGATQSGRPYFVMELVHGVPITQYCDDHHLTPHQRLELFVPVCQAIEHAHQKGVIHRDIKPSNVMVTLYDGKPVPKVIDFGVAKAIDQKLTERTLFTHYGRVIGTLEYMSPEQAEMSALGTDTRSDIYSLGVLLYELLTGSTPLNRQRIREAAYGEILRILKEEEPPKPSTRLTESRDTLVTISARRQTEPTKLTRLVRGELDWIVMKALEKDRTRRYETATSFAADVQRYLNDEPVQACPPSVMYRFRKFARKHRVGLTTSTLVVTALGVGTGVSVWQAQEAMAARRVSDQRLKEEMEARSEAERQQRRASVYLDQALQAIDQMITRVSEDKLVDVPGMHPLRQELKEHALQLQRTLARESPGDHRLARRLAHALLEVRDSRPPDLAERAIEEAIEIFQSLARQIPPEPADQAEVADGYRYLGWALLHLGRHEESEIACRESLRLGEVVYPKMPDGAGRIAQSKLIVAYVLNARNNHKEAESLLREVLPFHEKDFAESPYHWWSLAINFEQLAIASHGLGRDMEALQFYQAMKSVPEKYLEFLSQHPEISPTSQRLSPEKYRISGDMLSQWAARGAVALAIISRGLLEETMGNPENAAQSYRELTRYASVLVGTHSGEKPFSDWQLANEETLALLRIRLVAPLCASGRHEIASQVIKELPARTAEHVLARAQAYETLGDTAKARSDYESLMEMEVRQPSTLVRLFQIFMWGDSRLQNHGRAFQVAERLVHLAPDSAESWDIMGMAYADQQNYDSAKVSYRKAHELDPLGDRGLRGLAEIAVNEGQIDEAKALWEQAIQARPEEGGSWYSRASFHDRLGELEKAIADYTQALERKPQSYIYKRRALAHFKLGNYENALADVTSAVDLNPREMSNLTWIAPELIAGCSNEQFRAGILAVADRVVAMASPKQYALCVRASFLEALQDFDRAQADLEQAIRLGGEDPRALNQLAWLLSTCPEPKFRNPSRAVELAQRAVDLTPNQGALWNTLGVCHFRAGDCDAAVTALEKSVELRNGGDSFDWFFLAMSYWHLGQKEEARRRYDQAVTWMAKHQTQHKELRRFRAEAEELLGTPEKTAQQDPPGS